MQMLAFSTRHNCEQVESHRSISSNFPCTSFFQHLDWKKGKQDHTSMPTVPNEKMHFGIAFKIDNEANSRAATSVT